MSDDVNQPARRSLPWWLVAAGMGLSAVAFAALIAGSLLAVVLALLSAAIASEGRLPGAFAMLVLWAAYFRCFVLYGAQRFKCRWVLPGAAVLLIGAWVFFALPLGEAGTNVAVALGLGLMSHTMFMFAASLMRQADVIYDADRWARARLARGRCPQCDYDLRGLPAHRCPECGMTWSADEMHDEAPIARASRPAGL
jgi:hypothetical protein